MRVFREKTRDLCPRCNSLLWVVRIEDKGYEYIKLYCKKCGWEDVVFVREAVAC